MPIDCVSAGVIAFRDLMKSLLHNMNQRNTYGNESRTNNQLRTPGVPNYDFALYKDTPIRENVTFQFRLPISVPQGRLNLAQDASPGYI